MPSIAQYFPITDPTLIFFVVLCIILLAPIVMSRLRIPHIVGMVLAGVAIGQYGLNILERDSSFELFGRVGLLYIMFLAGLELNLTSIRKKHRQFLVFGLLTFLIPFVMAYFMGIFLLKYSEMTSLLLACILASNTLIAYPIVCKFGLQKHPGVALSVGSSMIALTLSLLILAAIVGSSDGESGVSFWMLFIVKVIAFCALSTMIVPRLTRWFFNHYADSVMLYIYVMCVLFFSAAISEICGLEGIFGAFVAGLLLNRYIPSVSPLMNRIEFIGNALFIPYFLIGVGMLIDFSVLFHGYDTLWVIFCMVMIATISKALAAYVSCFVFKAPWLSGHMMFGLTEAHAAGGIAMTMIGMNMMMPDGSYVFDANVLNGVVMMLLFTCIVSSIVVENTSQAILLKEKLYPTEQKPESDDEKILLPLQHDEDADTLVNLAILMRNKRLNRGLIGLNVVYDDTDSNRNRKEGRNILERAEATAISADVRMQTQSRLSTNIANGIKHAFKEFDASEIVMGLHHRTSPADSFWGAYTPGLISDINRQIMICRVTQRFSTLRMIHVAVPSRVEFEPGFYRWVEHVSRLADNIGCRIVFHGRRKTCDLIADFVKNRHPEVRADYEELMHWKELPSLASEIREDHLLVVVTARLGTVSYKPAVERLSDELMEYFPTNNLIIIYPDQHGQPQDVMTFTAPQRQDSESAYATVLNWINKIRS